MLLRHHNWELEAAAAVLLTVPYWGMGIIWSLELHAHTLPHPLSRCPLEEDNEESYYV